MTEKRTPKAKKAAENWKSTGSADDLAAVEQIAHGIVTARPDLMPSVERIMVSELDDDGRGRALGLFAEALTAPGDPNRDPRVAIAAAGRA
jgi:hypothetical protein